MRAERPIAARKKQVLRFTQDDNFCDDGAASPKQRGLAEIDVAER
jgi:hypothetical protein